MWSTMRWVRGGQDVGGVPSNNELGRLASLLPAHTALCLHTVSPPLQALLRAFKNLKNVEGMRIYFSEQDGVHYAVVQLECKGDIKKTHSLSYQDRAIGKPNFDRGSAPNWFIMRPGEEGRERGGEGREEEKEERGGERGERRGSMVPFASA